mmetsp:Transcript_2606/g.6725  ORF Transcript_2606/g.6725 Transcript_2606/m.6725 type:complete len:643 (+) Transcript_2606:483-2411(+)
MLLHKLLPDHNAAAVLRVADPDLLVEGGHELLHVDAVVIRSRGGADEEDPVLLRGLGAPLHLLDRRCEVLFDADGRIRVATLLPLLGSLVDLVHLIDVDDGWGHVLGADEDLVDEQGGAHLALRALALDHCRRQVEEGRTCLGGDSAREHRFARPLRPVEEEGPGREVLRGLLPDVRLREGQHAVLDQEGPDHLRRRRREVVLAPEAVVAPEHGAEVVVLAPEVLQVAGLDLLQDGLLHEVWHAILPVGDGAHRGTPLLRRLRLLRFLGLFLPLRLLLLGLREENLQVRQLLLHLVVHERAELGLHDGVHRLPRELDIVPLLEVVALVAILPHLGVLVDLLHELLHHRTGAHLVGLLLAAILIALLAALALLALVVLRLALVLPLRVLAATVLLLLFVEARVELVELLGKLVLLVEALVAVQDPLTPLLEEVGLDVHALLLLQPLQLLPQGLLEDLVRVLLLLLPQRSVRVHMIDDVCLGVVLRRRHVEELELLLSHAGEALHVDPSLPVRRDARGREHLALEQVIRLVSALLGLSLLALLLLEVVFPPSADHLRAVDAHAAPLVFLDDGHGLVRRQAHLEGILLVQQGVRIQGHAEDPEPVVDLVLLVLDLLAALLVVEEVPRHLPLDRLGVELQVCENLI